MRFNFPGFPSMYFHPLVSIVSDERDFDDNGRPVSRSNPGKEKVKKIII